MRVDDSEYRIRKCTRDGFYKAYMKVNERKHLFVLSAKTRAEVEKRLREKKPQPKQDYDPTDKVQRLTAHQKSAFVSVNEGRKLNDLPLLKIQIRNCLKCSMAFESTGKRICELCHSTGIFNRYSALQGREII